MRLRVIAVAVLLTACQLGVSGQTPDAPEANPITGGQIRVTTLDPGAAPPAATPAPQPAPPAPVPAAEPVPEPEPQQTAPTPAAPALQSAPQATAKSASQLTCEKRGGAWVGAGNSGIMTCQTPQRDGGKACRRDSDCEGQCLARSRSCAPFSPLFGCNEVLQDNGQRVTLCIE